MSEHSFAEFEQQRAHIEQVLARHERKKTVKRLSVAEICAESLQIYLVDKALRESLRWPHARSIWQPYEGAAEFRRKVTRKSDANITYVGELHAELLARGEAGIAGLKSLFLAGEHLLFRLGYLRDAVELFPDEAEPALLQMAQELEGQPGFGNYPGSIEAALKKIRGYRARRPLENAPSLANENDLAPALASSALSPLAFPEQLMRALARHILLDGLSWNEACLASWRLVCDGQNLAYGEFDKANLAEFDVDVRSAIATPLLGLFLHEGAYDYAGDRYRIATRDMVLVDAQGDDVSPEQMRDVLARCLFHDHQRRPEPTGWTQKRAAPPLG